MASRMLQGFLVDLIIAGTDFHLGHISHKDSHASTYESVWHSADSVPLL